MRLILSKFFYPDVGNEWEGKKGSRHSTRFNRTGRIGSDVHRRVDNNLNQKIFVITHYRHKLGVSCSK